MSINYSEKKKGDTEQVILETIQDLELQNRLIVNQKLIIEEERPQTPPNLLNDNQILL